MLMCFVMFHHVIGLENLKSFCLRAMRRQGHRDPRKRPRGALLLGVPGTGKSAYSKALGAETGRPTLIMDVGALLPVGQLHGQPFDFAAEESGLALHRHR